MPKFELESIPQRNATGYPAKLANVVQGRWYRRLGPAAGLTDFGVSHYPDIDLHLPDGNTFTRKDGSSY